jgi:hypothetical protein
VAGGVSPSSKVFPISDRTRNRQVTGVEVRSDGLEIRHAARDDSGSVSSTTERNSKFV